LLCVRISGIPIICDICRHYEAAIYPSTPNCNQVVGFLILSKGSILLYNLKELHFVVFYITYFLHEVIPLKLRNFSLLLLTFVLSATLLIGCGGPKTENAQVVNILSANYEEQIAIQLDYLRELFPDAQINITYMSSGKLAAKLQAEGPDGETDIALSLSSGYANQLKDAGLLMPYEATTPYKTEYADPDNIILPNGVWAGAILVNTAELSRLGLPEPTSYKDLLDPVYKGHIVMSSPVSSSTGYFFLQGILNLYGEEGGWDYFDKLSENIMLFGESGSIPSSMVEKGEVAIGLGIDYEGMRLAADGKPVKVIFAEEGAPFDYDTVLLIKRNNPPSEFVLAVMEAITSPEGNAVFNNYNISVLEGVADRGEYPADFKLLDMTGIADPELKTINTNTWSERYE
jgi:iron(III) transport system substrate-binding protein